MDVTISLPDEFAERIQKYGISPADYVKLLFTEAMRKASARELKSRPADTQKFLDASAAERKAAVDAEILKDKADRIEALRVEEEQQAAAKKVAAEELAASALPT